MTGWWNKVHKNKPFSFRCSSCFSFYFGGSKLRIKIQPFCFNFYFAVHIIRATFNCSFCGQFVFIKINKSRRMKYVKKTLQSTMNIIRNEFFLWAVNNWEQCKEIEKYFWLARITMHSYHVIGPMYVDLENWAFQKCAMHKRDHLNWLMWFDDSVDLFNFNELLLNIRRKTTIMQFISVNSIHVIDGLNFSNCRRNGL